LTAVYSMTGYGQASQRLTSVDSAVQVSSGAVTVDLRSVNSRFLDITLKLPDDARAAEPALRELLTKHLKRGKVELRVSLERVQASGQTLDPAALQQLALLQTALMQHAPQAASARPLSVAEWLRWPGVMQEQGGQSSAAAATDWQPAVLAASAAALESFVASRAREGMRMAAFLSERCKALDALAAQAARLTPDAVAKYQERFIARWKEALASAGGLADETAARDRALNEAAAYALRIDIAEEIGRLQSHTTECREMLAAGGELGKRLDFLTQELNREANTLSSKAAGIELTRIGMEMKLHIEQMREQVQNIE
jgi:uncharacterized protein (TIGR00255 family)